MNKSEWFSGICFAVATVISWFTVIANPGSSLLAYTFGMLTANLWTLNFGFWVVRNLKYKGG